MNNTTTTTNPILTAINDDAGQIITGGASLPARDASGQRTFNHGEKKVLLAYESKVGQILNNIKKDLSDLKAGMRTRVALAAELETATLRYHEAQQADEAELEKVNDQLEQLGVREVPNPMSAQHTPSKTKEEKKKSKGLFSFLLVAFIAEFVAFLATFNLQQENLSTDAIWWRLAYIGVIYVYTIILYLKYVKTHVAVVKGLLIGCIVMGFACLMHAMAVTFLNLDVIATANMGFDLSQIEPEEAEANTGIVFNLISKPGLIEFLVSTLLVFIGEIVTIEGGNKEETETNTAAVPSEEFGVIDLEGAARQNTLIHMATLREKQMRLREKCNKRTVEFNDYVNGINERLEANEQKIEQANTSLGNHQQEKRTVVEKILSDLASYRKLLMDDLAIRLGVEASSFQYEPATKEDVEAYYKLQPIVTE